MAYFKARAFAQLTFAKTSGIVGRDREGCLFHPTGGQEYIFFPKYPLVKRDRAIICVLCLDLHLT